MRQQYDSYKPSGIDWIGDIPSHWNIIPIKQICRSEKYAVKTGPFGSQLKGEDLRENGDIRVYNQRNVIDNDFSDVTSFVTSEKAKELDSFYTRPNDLLITSRGTIGKSAILPTSVEMGILHPCLIALRIDISQANLKWVQRWINDSEAFRIEIASKSNATTIDVIYTETIKNIRLALPPLAEQEAIAAWLDEKCGEIDAAIAKVDREIELIDELKQSEISRVVTRGLNPDTPLRPSGIDWIGDVPEHWVNTRIKFNILRSAAGVWGDDEKGDENDIVCFRIADFDYDERCLSTEKITIRNIESKQLEGRYLSKGDLLIEKSGGGESTPVGRVVYCNYNGKATYTNFIHSITLSDSVDSRFFLYYFNMLYSNKVNLLFFNQTTGLQNLQVSDYLGQSICLPPLSEQQAIADYLDKKCAEIDGLKAKLSKKSETLTELRQSIISEVVTGKRKVI